MNMLERKPHKLGENLTSVSSIHALYPSINQEAFNYYQEVIETMKPQNDTKIILVAHSYETIFALAQSVQLMGNLCGVVLKHSTGVRFPQIRRELERTGLPILPVTKDLVVRDMSEVVQLVDEAIPKGSPFVIMDHGGYFAYNRKLFDYFPPERLVGVAEHTLNGEERYRSLGLNDRPVVSIGKSAIKLPSDEAASDAIVLASDNYLQTGGVNLNSPLMRVGIIGYGRLGARIGQQLSTRNINRVLVHDSNSSKLVGMRGHSTASKTDIIQKCNVIFCATGNQAILPEHYALMKNNTIIFTVTSPDDELKLDKMVESGVLAPVPEKSHGDTYVYRVTSTGNEIILPFNGESPNTSLPYGIADPIIHQTYAAHIAATIRVTNNPYPKGLSSLEPEFEEVVSRLWLKHFGPQEENFVTTPHSKARRPSPKSKDRAITTNPTGVFTPPSAIIS